MCRGGSLRSKWSQTNECDGTELHGSYGTSLATVVLCRLRTALTPSDCRLLQASAKFRVMMVSTTFGNRDRCSSVFFRILLGVCLEFRGVNVKQRVRLCDDGLGPTIQSQSVEWRYPVIPMTNLGAKSNLLSQKRTKSQV